MARVLEGAHAAGAGVGEPERARPGEVTSMPSFTRSGRPSFSFASSASAGQHVDGVPREFVGHEEG